ncbi:MAG: AIR synthase-related protein, partial [Planctomycetota bacterium]
VGELSMELLHRGRPPVVRQAVYDPPAPTPLTPSERDDYGEDLRKILGALNVASKEWIIRQYDHEVQGGSVVKPLVGIDQDGPSDAAVIRPVLASRRGVAISCGMNPRYGDFDTYHMAASAIDEAVRNCVAVGADPRRIAILDNFCWGDCENRETLGALVRASLACRDVAIALETPFVSGKDSLNNEFSYVDDDQRRRTIAIPPTLLISAMGQVEDVATCVTMDLKQAGNRLYLVGVTRNEMGGSHLALVNDLPGGRPPIVEPKLAKATFQALHAAITSGLVVACHDLSEGGLAVAAAEMAFAGGLGADLRLDQTPVDEPTLTPAVRLFSESNSRFLCEVPVAHAAEFERVMNEVALAHIGEVRSEGSLRCSAEAEGRLVMDAPIDELKRIWKSPLAR